MAESDDSSLLTSTSFGPVTDEGDDSKEQIRRLYRDLELGADSEYSEKIDLRNLLGLYLALSGSRFVGVARDLSLFCGLSNDWELAFEVLQKLEKLRPEEIESLSTWKLRCLVELQRNAEAIALVHSVKWDPSALIHVNYLTGLAYEALGLVDQAQLRFKAVFEADPRYRDIRQKIAT